MSSTQPRGPHDEPPSYAHGAAEDRVTDRDVGRHRLAGHRAAVDGRLPEDDLSVGGDGLAGSNDEPISFAECGDRSALLDAGGVEHATSLAPTAERARRALPLRRLLRASKYLPARRKVVTPAATSR